MIRSCPYPKAHWGAVLAGQAVLLAAAALPGWGQSSWPNYPNDSTVTVTSGGNVGIGTSGPIPPLDAQAGTNINVAGGFDGNTGTPYLQSANNAANTNEPLEFLGSKFSFFGYSGTRNVGIGTTYPGLCI
jgi:hypothetical protein